VKITYTPRDGEPREWLWKPAQTDSREVELIEEVMGDLPWVTCVSKFLAGSTRARRALMWVFLRRENPALRFDQVWFRMDEVGDDFDDDEIAAMRRRLEGPPEDDPVDADARERIAEILAERDGAADQVAEDVAGVEPGKDTAEPAAAGSST
jgi:hypothetical protein